jgi:hypothetical protein
METDSNMETNFNKGLDAAIKGDFKTNMRGSLEYPGKPYRMQHYSAYKYGLLHERESDIWIKNVKS